MCLPQIKFFQMVRFLNLGTRAVAIQALFVEVTISRSATIILWRLAYLVANRFHLDLSCSVVANLIR